MKTVKTNTLITDFEGNNIKDRGGELLTVGNQIANALAIHKSNPARCWQLGKAFATEKEVELKAEDVVFVKQALEELVKGGQNSALIVGQILEMLDSKD